MAALQRQRGGVPFLKGGRTLAFLLQHESQLDTIVDQIRDVIAVLGHQIACFRQDALGVHQGALVPAPDPQLPQGQRLLCGALIAVLIQPRQPQPHPLGHSGGGQLHLDAPALISGQGHAGPVDLLRERIRVLNVIAPDEQAGMFVLILPPHRFQVREGQGVHRHPGVVEQIPPAQRLVAARVYAHHVLIQRLEPVDGLDSVFGRAARHCGDQRIALPHTQRPQPLPDPVLFPLLAGELGQVVKIIQFTSSSFHRIPVPAPYSGWGRWRAGHNHTR